MRANWLGGGDRRCVVRTLGVSNCHGDVSWSLRAHWRVASRSGEAAPAPKPRPSSPGTVSVMSCRRCGGGRASAQAVPVQTRAIGDGVSHFSAAGSNALVVVTPDGVVMMDPIGLVNPNAPAALREAIAALTDRPVTRWISSHDHADHITGGAVFSGARVIAHRLAAPKIAASGDARMPVPTELLDVYLQVDVGGRDMHWFSARRNLSDNRIVLHIPSERLIVAINFLPVRTLPVRDLPDRYLPEWAESRAWIVRSLEFDRLVPGHGAIGAKADGTALRRSVLDLIEAVLAANDAGLPDTSFEMVAFGRARLAPVYGREGQLDPFLLREIEGVIREGVA